MTAKESYQNLINSFINEENVNTFEGRLKVFAEQICREQREICANEGKEIIASGDTFGLRPSPKVLHAPMPEI